MRIITKLKLAAWVPVLVALMVCAALFFSYQVLENTQQKRAIARQVQERKRVQEDLGREREWLRVTLSSIGDAVIATDGSGNISFLNPVAAALTAWPPEEALGQPIGKVFEIINESTREPAEDAVSRDR